MCLVFPYVGIIQIRLRVETNQFPLSRLQPAPLFCNFTFLLYCQLKKMARLYSVMFCKKAEKQKRKTKSTNIEKRICLCYSVMEYISLGRGGQYESINIIGRFEIYLLSGQHRTVSLYSCI